MKTGLTDPNTIQGLSQLGENRRQNKLHIEDNTQYLMYY